jgi:hypothetical protein
MSRSGRAGAAVFSASPPANPAGFGIDFAAVFRWVFVAAEAFLVVSLTMLTPMEERPLRGADRGAGKAGNGI